MTEVGDRKTRIRKGDALTRAIDATGFETLTSILKEGADPNAVDATGRVPMEACCGLNTADDFSRCVRLLLAFGADPNLPEKFPVLLHAAGEESPALVQALLKAGADPNIQEKDTGETPLLIATECGYPKTVRVLLEHGATPATFVYGGARQETPLGVAILRGDATIIRLLGAFGATKQHVGFELTAQQLLNLARKGDPSERWAAVEKALEALDSIAPT